MKRSSAKLWAITGILLLGLMLPGWAAAQVTLGRVVVFGDSLSDPGNAFALTHLQNTPPYENGQLLQLVPPLLIPSAPYAVGGHHFSNGATWIEQLAISMGAGGSAGPAFQNAGTASNYAVGGARARPAAQATTCSMTVSEELDLGQQVNQFLLDHSGAAPVDALYVVQIGGNDVRDAFAAAALPSGNPGLIVGEALGAVEDNITCLYQAGARKFLVLNVPNIARTPAVQIATGHNPSLLGFAAQLTNNFNLGLSAKLEALKTNHPDIQIVPLDLYQVLENAVTGSPQNGLADVTDPCIMPGTPNFMCAKPSTFLFWDGIHPTKFGHGIIEDSAESALNNAL